MESEPLSVRRAKDSSQALAPVFTQVDVDPSQAQAWQKEASVRHIQESTANNQTSFQQNGAFQQEWHMDKIKHPPSPYATRINTPDSPHGNPRGDYSNTEWGRPQQNDSVGVAGAG